MRKTAFEMMREMAFELGFISDLSITSFTDANLRAQMLIYLNRAKDTAARKVGLNILAISVPFETVAQYSTGTVTATAGDTTITGVGTVFTSAMVGRKIQLGTDLNSYQILKFTDATHIEIDRPYTGTAQAGVSYKIFQDVYGLGPRLSSIEAIIRPTGLPPLSRRTLNFMLSRYPDPLQGTGEPRNFSEYDVLETREPATANYAADATTDSGNVVEASLISVNIQDYYKDWYLYNSTRSASSKVSAYNVSNTTLSLEKPITGQVVTDSFYLKKRELRIILRPTPLAAYNLFAVGKKEAKGFVNDTDYESEIDAGYEDGLIYQGISEYYKAHDQARMTIWEVLANGIWDQLLEFNNASPGAREGFTGGGTGATGIVGISATSVSWSEPGY